MGTRGRAIVKNADHIIELLNKAFADEWLAYYQYWIGAKVVEGPMKDALITELVEHANDELRHGDMIAERILQLKGTPLLKPEEWYKKTNCGYDTPDDPYVMKIIEQNIQGEQCAIDVYNKLLKETQDTDPVTNDMVLQILTDEVDHEEDLQNFQDDLKAMLERMK